MAKRKAAPKDDAVEGGAPQEAPDNSVYIGKSLKPESKPQFIYLRLANRHGLITGATGTGKTYNLVALYLRLLLETDLTVDRILVVTYTLAAKAELRSRLRLKPGA